MIEVESGRNAGRAASIGGEIDEESFCIMDRPRKQEDLDWCPFGFGGTNSTNNCFEVILVWKSEQNTESKTIMASNAIPCGNELQALTETIPTIPYPPSSAAFSIAIALLSFRLAPIFAVNIQSPKCRGVYEYSGSARLLVSEFR